MMSEPPLKKKKTLLDYFKRNDKGKMPAKDKNSSVKAYAQEPVLHSPAKKEEPTKDASNIPLKNSLKAEKEDQMEPAACGSSNGLKLAATTTSSQESFTDSTLQMTPELFSDDSQDQELDIPEKKPSQRRDGCLWKGKPFPQLKRRPEDTSRLPPLRPDENHHIFFKIPFRYDEKKMPHPHPPNFKDVWDADHVRMPCSSLNEYPVKGKDGKTVVKRRWDIIQNALSNPIPGTFELEQAILAYNTRYTDKWDFQTMHSFFLDELIDKEREHFFEHTLPKIANLALLLPNLLTQPIPLLKKGKSKNITMSQQQIACLLANAFFCTFPRRNARQRSSEFSNYPSINFNTIFDGHPNKRKLEKMKCIIHYFRRVTDKMPAGTVTFKRQCINGKFPQWDKMERYLTDIHVSAEGTIEDDGQGLLQVDFANKFIGGGVLGMGCVQEEIRFLICPEMIVSRLFTECLEKNESFIMIGCERFSNYDGYANTFMWNGDYNDKTSRDDWGRICTDVLAIDAMVIHNRSNQFKEFAVRRELNKAYCGFIDWEEVNRDRLPAVCTGNWGCGAFGGDKRLKALIQLMAASAAGREMCYYTFDDVQLRDELHEIHQYLTKTNQLAVGNIMTIISQYERNVISRTWKKGKEKISLFQYIPRVFDGSLEQTDSEPESPGPSPYSPSSMEGKIFNNDEDEMDKEKDGKMQRQDSEDYRANTP